MFYNLFKNLIINNLFNKVNDLRRGCAFVTFFSLTDADIAIEALNENFFLPGSTAKLQLKWADGEARRLGINDVDPS